MADTLEEALLAAGNESTVTEEVVFVIDNELRTIDVPVNFILGVYNDKEVHEIPFKMPRYYKDIDLSEFAIQVNYINAINNGDVYFVENAEIADDEITFTWLTTRSVFAANGVVNFTVCLKKSDEEGNVLQEFNTTIAKANVLTGIEVEPDDTETAYDIIAHMRTLESRSAQAVSDAQRAVANVTTTVEEANELIDDAEGLIGESRDTFAYLRAMVGSPLVAHTAAEMTDTDKIYVYAGSETGYKKGYWYYYDNGSWHEGLAYDTSALAPIVKVQTEEPLASETKIWIDPEGASIEIPTMQDFNTFTDQINQTVNEIEEDVADLKQDLDDLTDRVTTIENEEGLHKYGVSGIGQAASQLTRLWDAVGMTAQVGTDGDNSGVVNNFDDVTPFNRRKCVGTWHKSGDRAVFHVHAYLGDDDYTEDGTNGDYVAVECPRAYYYLKDGVLGVSAHHYPEWRPFDIFCRNHNPEDTMEYCYLPAYALAVNDDGKAVCLPGYDNEQGTYKSLVDAARTYKGGELGNLAILQPAAVNFYEWALFTVEFARQNCQSVMQGAAGLRHSNDDRVTFTDATHVITNNYYAARVVGECVAIVATNIDQNNVSYKATHRILSIIRCDADGTPSTSGTHQLIELEDFGKTYYDYDTTGATEYKFVTRPYRTGDCNGVSTPSGSPVSNTDSYHPMRYRYRENVYSNQYHTLMDLFIKRVGTGDDDWTLEWYYLPDPSVYEPSAASKPDAVDLATDAFESLDVLTSHDNYRNGYIKSRIYSNEYHDIWISGEVTGGSASTYYADYASLVYSNVVRACRLGGSWYYGAYDGFSNLYAHSALSSGAAIYGGDLCIIQ